MSNTALHKRKQYSSCDACRRSRVACDASKHGYHPGKIRWRGSCSRCASRKRSCTFEWIGSLEKRSPHLQQETSSKTTRPLDGHGDSSPVSEPADHPLEGWYSHIFHQGFEVVFGKSVGRDSCPFVDDSGSEICIPAMKLFSTLDSYMVEGSSRQSLGYNPEIQEERQKRNDWIDQSLRSAVKAFSAHWLSLVPQKPQVEEHRRVDIIRESWRAARRQMLKTINHPSYRSALALYLFSQTLIPVGISDDEELDGISSLLCLQAALLQIQKLRERQKGGQFHGSLTSAWKNALVGSKPGQDPAKAYLDLESRAYWAAVMWDTTNSLTSGFRACLTSGLKGACSEPVWRLTRAFLVGSFCPRTGSWLTKGFEVSDNTASQIFGAATVCKMYLWKNITSLKEALREGVEEEGVFFTWTALLDALEIFNTSIRPLLNICERQLHFLDQLRRMTWYQVNLQYYLGILVMIDAMEAAQRSDLIAQVSQEKSNAEHELVNVIKFGLESTYTIRPPEGSLDTSLVNVPLITVDPNPHHMVDCVALMNKAINSKHRQGNMKYESYSYLYSTLHKALEHVPQHSKMVQLALQNLERSYSKV